MEILNKQVLVDNANVRIIRLDILSPAIAAKAKAGQFVALMADVKGERIPLTIVDSNAQKGMISIVFQEVGLTTRLLGQLKPPDKLYALSGPLGHATEVLDYGKVILVGGGLGIAEIYPVAKALKARGNNITAVLGARSKGQLILENELKGVCDQIYFLTDDGSYGEKGFTTDKLLGLLKEGSYDLVYTVGPIAMMRKVSEITGNFAVRTIASLNALMVDATGMCGCCRVTVAGEVKFSCVDGPEFDAQKVDWDQLQTRNRMYQDSEEHICKLEKQA